MAVAERAVLARGRPDGRYDVFLSRWGGTDRVLAAVAAGRSPFALAGVRWRAGPTGVRFGTLVAALDYPATEMVYRQDGTTTALLPLWFGLPLSDVMAAPTLGALVGVRSLPDARAVRAWFRRVKGALADAVVAGSLPAPVAALAPLAAVGSLRGRPVHVAVDLSAMPGPDAP